MFFDKKFHVHGQKILVFYTLSPSNTDQRRSQEFLMGRGLKGSGGKVSNRRRQGDLEAKPPALDPLI